MNRPIRRVLLKQEQHEVCRLHEPPYIGMSIGLCWRKWETLAIGLVLEIVLAISADSLRSPGLIRETGFHISPEVLKRPSNVEIIVP